MSKIKTEGNKVTNNKADGIALDESRLPASLEKQLAEAPTPEERVEACYRFLRDHNCTIVTGMKPEWVGEPGSKIMISTGAEIQALKVD